MIQITIDNKLRTVKTMKDDNKKIEEIVEK